MFQIEKRGSYLSTVNRRLLRLRNPVFFRCMHSSVVHCCTVQTTFHLRQIKSINSPPSPTVSSPSRSIPQKAPVPNNHQVTRGILIGLGNTHISSGHGRELRVRIIRRGNLNNIGRDDMQAVQASQDGAQLARRPPASLGSACRGCERRVDRIDLHPEKIEK
jgi:hypothetical protein